MFRKSLSVLLAIVMMMGIFTVCPFTAIAQETVLIGSGADVEIAAVGNPYPDWNGNYPGNDSNCTWTAWQQAYNRLGVSLPIWGNAKDWYAGAQASGYATGSTPRANSIVVFSAQSWNDYYGHVAYVTDYNSATGKIYKIEGNYNGAYHEEWAPAYESSMLGYIYLDEVGNNPTSALDSVSGGTGTVHVSGWTFDRDDPTQSLSVHVYIGGGAGTPGAEGVAIPANVSRKDVDNAFHVGEFHGFDTVIPTSKTGNQDIYVYAINIGGGQNTEIGHKTVYISPDTVKPTCDTAYLSQVTQNSFRVCAVPNDNVGIKEVRIATWTQSDQSDLIWHTANFNGSDTYFVNVNRSDYSNNKNSFYYNHIYVYDYAGNNISIACNQDYKITSDTGKSVPEGEYRIATAINESRALDVANGSADSGANIQIYANFVSPKQTFNLLYVENGFYTIANSFSGLVLDVAGDTYVNNTNVMQHIPNGGANQEWMIKPSGDGFYYIISRTNGLALDVTNADDRDGANVAVHTQNQSVAQKWKLRRVIKDDMVTITGWTPKGGIYQPTVKVVVDGQTLTKDVDYTVSTYIDNETLYAKVTGIGNYCDSISVEYQEKTVYLGDVDGDEVVTIIDATAIQRHLASIPTASYNEKAADADEDGEVTIIDATAIQRHLAQLPSNENIGKPMELNQLTDRIL